METIKEKIIDADAWYNDYNQPREKTGDELPIFEMKLVPGQLSRKETIIFVTDGKKATTRFGETIIFTIRHGGLDKTWFIKKNQYSILNPIALERKKGSIVGLEATIERVGQGQKETRWALKFKE